MLNFKSLREMMILTLLVGILTFTSTSYAEVQIYEGIGEYAITTAETMEFAKNQAQLEAERNIAEQAYVYVTSQTEMENSVVNHDEIVVVTESVMRIINVNFQVIPTADDTFIVRAIVKAEIDTDEIENIIEDSQREQVE